MDNGIRTVQDFRAWAEDNLRMLERSAVRNPAQEQVMRAVLHRLRDVPDTPATGRAHGPAD